MINTRKLKGGESMKFYSVQIRESIEVADDKIEIITMKNGKKAAKAEVDYKGQKLKLFRIVQNNS